MKTTTQTAIDMLTEQSVSILTQTFIEFEGELKEIGNHRKAYVNSDQGRIDLQAEQAENTINAVFTIWGDAPEQQFDNETMK